MLTAKNAKYTKDIAMFRKTAAGVPNPDTFVSFVLFVVKILRRR